MSRRTQLDDGLKELLKTIGAEKFWPSILKAQPSLLACAPPKFKAQYEKGKVAEANAILNSIDPGSESLKDNVVHLKAIDGPAPIRRMPGLAHVAADELVRRLLDAGIPLFQRSKLLVHPHRGYLKLRSEVKQPDGKLKPMFVNYPITHACEVDVHALDEASSKVAVWEKYDKRANEWRRCDADKKVLNYIISRRGDGFNILSSITTVPFILPCNTIISEFGYHADSGIFLSLDEGLNVPSVPRIVDEAIAFAASRLLEGLLAEFKFVGDIDKAVAMSALITPVVRKAMDVAPLHAISAPIQGSGKSYLTDIASIIRSGAPMPSQAARDDLPGELDKGLTTAVLRDAPMISIDNVTDVLASPLLAQIIERGIVTVRVFGQLTAIDVTNSISLYASGNNLRVKGDLRRRTLLCKLDREDEHPENHEYECEPVKMALRDRGKYVAACLTIARFGLQGGVYGLKKLNSFEDWSKCVREPLVRLGYADPIESQKETEEDDPEQEMLRTVLNEWKGEKSVTEAMKEPELYVALVNVAPDGKGGINSQKLGNYLAKNRGRIVDGLKLVKNPVRDRLRGSLWSVVKVKV